MLPATPLKATAERLDGTWTWGPDLGPTTSVTHASLPVMKDGEGSLWAVKRFLSATRCPESDRPLYSVSVDLL